MILKNLIVLGAVISAFALASCNSGHETKTDALTDTIHGDAGAEPVNPEAEFKFTYTIANLPSPLQILDEFARSGLPVNVSLLNATENARKYQTSLKLAFNYGIYGIDLGYCVTNNRTLETIKYYSTCKQLAEQLNLSETFNRFVNRFESNAENKDSLARIIDEAYAATDAYLRNNERLLNASQALAGSWLEAQYITVNLLKNAERNENTEKLFQRIWEQRFYLDNISQLLEQFKGDKELEKIQSDFKGLLALYKEPAEAMQINNEFLNKLAAKLEEVRKNIIQ
jgi:hypothetical protein